MSLTSEKLQHGIRKYLIDAEDSPTTIVSKTSIVGRIDRARASLRHVANIPNSLDRDHLQGIYLHIQENAAEMAYSRMYTQVINKVDPTAQKRELAKPLTLMFDVAGRLIATLDAMEDRVTKDFPEKVNLATLRFTHLAVFGALDCCSMYSKLTSFLFQGIFNEIIEDAPDPHAYRFEYLTVHQQDFINILNWVATNRGPIAFETAMTELRNTNNDVTVTNDEGTENIVGFNGSQLSRTTFTLLGISLQNPFFLIGRAYATWEKNRIKRLEQEREWIEATVSLLKLELDHEDKDSPNYIRQAKIVKNYSAELSKIDRQLAKYYKEEVPKK